MLGQSKRLWIIVTTVTLIVVGGVAAYVFVINSGPGISTQEVQAAEQGLEQTIQAAEAGNVDAAIDAFMGHPHDLTHRIDPLLYDQNPELAAELRSAVVQLETEFVEEQPQPNRIVEAARRVKEVLRVAATELGVKNRAD